MKIAIITYLKTLSKIIFLMFFVFTSCTQNSQKKSDFIKITTERNFDRELMYCAYKEDVLISKKYLPSFITNKEYWIIYRLGSNEFSDEFTVLCLPKKQMKQNEINCEYFSMNFYTNDSVIVKNYQFKLNNTLKNTDDFFQKLNNKDMCSYSYFEKEQDIIDDGIPFCESHCCNHYFIDNLDNIVIIPRKSLVFKNLLKRLYQQISASEYYQSFSLDKECGEQFDLYIKLKENLIDTLAFKIK